MTSLSIGKCQAYRKVNGPIDFGWLVGGPLDFIVCLVVLGSVRFKLEKYVRYWM